jgi:hypothetical protein
VALGGHSKGRRRGESSQPGARTHPHKPLLRVRHDACCRLQPRELAVDWGQRGGPSWRPKCLATGSPSAQKSKKSAASRTARTERATLTDGASLDGRARDNHGCSSSTGARCPRFSASTVPRTRHCRSSRRLQPSTCSALPMFELRSQDLSRQLQRAARVTSKLKPTRWHADRGLQATHARPSSPSSGPHAAP